jgi:heptosyltransferase I
MALLSAEHKTGFGSPYSREGHHLFTNTAYDLPENLHQVEIFFALAKKFAGIDKQIQITAEDLKLPVSELQRHSLQKPEPEYWLSAYRLASQSESLEIVF